MKPSPSSTAQQRHQRRARKVGLQYVHDEEPGYTRRRCGKGFIYLSPQGRRITSPRILKRIESLVIPPAWNEVWICRSSTGHLQATGRDEAGRKQYLYHSDWTTISAATKFDRLALVAQLLPRIRRRVRSDLQGKELTRERVLAAVVRLLDKAHLRVGNERYLIENGSRGATTLASEHVEVDRFLISLNFPGKSGQQHEIEFSDPKTARVIEQCEEINGQYLFCYRCADGEFSPVNSTEVNSYLQQISGEDLTAKDFRTWWGSVIALASLVNTLAEQGSEKLTKQQVRHALSTAISITAQTLGNTKAVCRSHYIHPSILTAFETGELPGILDRSERRSEPIPELVLDEVRLAQLLPFLEFS